MGIYKSGSCYPDGWVKQAYNLTGTFCSACRILDTHESSNVVYIDTVHTAYKFAQILPFACCNVCEFYRKPVQPSIEGSVPGSSLWAIDPCIAPLYLTVTVTTTIVWYVSTLYFRVVVLTFNSNMMSCGCLSCSQLQVRVGLPFEYKYGLEKLFYQYGLFVVITPPINSLVTILLHV